MLDKDVKIGDVGDVDFKLRDDGKIEISFIMDKKLDASDTEFSASVKVVQGEKMLLDKLVAALPAGLLRSAAQAAEDLALKSQSAAPSA